MGFANRVALITGASSGIGQALARQLAAAGCRVGLLARRGSLLQALAEEISVAGGTAAWISADVSQREQVLASARDLAGKLGPIDLLIANAGMGSPTRLTPFNTEEQEQVIRVNFLGVIYAIEAVLPGMLERGRGHLAAVSSLAAYKGLPGEAAYCASKAALHSYLEALRIQLRGKGVTVTTLCPGFVATPMTADHPFKMPWLLSADEAARRILLALKRRQKVVDFPWQLALLMKLARWVPDWIVARIVASRKPPPD